MRIRSILLLAFLFATLIPSIFFGWWAYSEGVKREFADVKDRHLLLAHNVGNALERYHVDLVAAIETISMAMLSGGDIPQVTQLFKGLNLECIMLVDMATGKTIQKVELVPSARYDPPAKLFEQMKALVDPDTTRFSPVMAGADGSNVIFAVHQHGSVLAIARIGTAYFVKLGKSISFGTKGHAAIVDQEGNVLAHPLPAWVAARKNIAKVSAVQRMMNGETGIQQFYSPALKGDMIAGLTSVPGVGWGVMIPQPISELYDKVLANNKSIFLATGLGILISLALVALFLGFSARPMQNVIDLLHSNAKASKLGKMSMPQSVLAISEIREFQDSYNGMVDQVVQANSRIEGLAYTDSVTNLPNRAKFQQLVEAGIENSKHSGEGGILVFLDIDNFKEINDMSGHDVGDSVLRSIAAKLYAVSENFHHRLMETNIGQAREKPCVARIGGDEFTLLVPDLSDGDEINWFLDSLLQEIAQMGGDNPVAQRCSASIGCARYPADGDNLEQLLRHADMAMYHAKKQGKNRAQLYDVTIGTMTEAELRSEFARAIPENQLVLEYQPKICTRRKVVAGVEALVRWNHPRLGRIAPDAWLPALSSSRLVNDLGDWVIGTAMRDQVKWQAQGHNLTVAVNVSSEQFGDKNLVSMLKRKVAETGIKPASFEIEVTEDALFLNEIHAESALHQLSDFGFRISIDDFGKGYSNFARLAQMPLDFIKIDQSLVVGAANNPKICTILDTTISMAQNLNCKIIAEGIETLESARFATEMGANMLQGFYFSHAMPAVELIDWLSDAANLRLISYQAEPMRSVA